MKIKLLKSVNFRINRTMPIGTVHPARKLVTGLMQINSPYQIIEGPLSGKIIPFEDCIVIEDEKTFTEFEVKALENIYKAKLEKERQEKERAQEMVKELTGQINKKNKENEKINFFLECSNLALVASCQAIETLREKKAN